MNDSGTRIGKTRPSKAWFSHLLIVFGVLAGVVGCDPVGPGTDREGRRDVGYQDAGIADTADGGVADSRAADRARPDTAAPDRSLGLQQVGTAQTLEVATWNIQDFPKAGDMTVELLAGAIQDLQLDLIAVEEISDMRDFQRLLTRLDGYQGVLNPDSYSGGNYQKTGLIFRSDVIQVVETAELFDGEWYAFPRSPFEAKLIATDPSGGGSWTFTIIVVHLKAGTTHEDHDRRLQGMLQLDTYIDGLVAADSSQDIILTGDFNAKVTGGYSDVFDPIFDDPATYTFVTRSLAQSGEWSLPDYQIFIDHIIVVDQATADLNGLQVRALRLDQQITGYTDQISDHRPIVSLFEPSSWR